MSEAYEAYDTSLTWLVFTPDFEASMCSDSSRFLSDSLDLTIEGAPNMASISSSVLPFVSGTQNHAQNPMHTISEAKNMYVPYPREVIMYGVVRLMMKDQSHWSAVVMATQSMRMSIGYISEHTTHVMPCTSPIH